MGITLGSPDKAAAAAGRHVRANPSRPFWQRASTASRPAAVGLLAIPITEGKFRACLADDQQSCADSALGRRRRKGDSLRGHVANRSSVRSGQWRRPRFPRPGHGHCDAVAPMLSPRVNGKGTPSCKRSMARGIYTASIQNNAVLSNMASATILHRRRRC